MHLSPKEERLIQELRGIKTCMVIVTQINGEIRGIKTEVSAEIADKAAGRGDLWQSEVSRGTQGPRPQLIQKKSEGA